MSPTPRSNDSENPVNLSKLTLSDPDRPRSELLGRRVSNSAFSDYEDEIHLGFMREAIKMAEEALSIEEVPVGCVFVHDGKIIARGRNATNETLNGTAHAELMALSKILHPDCGLLTKEGCLPPGTDLYVTVEPCVMCGSALRQLKVSRVFFGCLNDRFGGNGGVFGVHDDVSLSGPPYASFGGYYKHEAILLLRRFYIRENGHAPVPQKKASRVLKTEFVGQF